jgi:hypothetical protein
MWAYTRNIAYAKKSIEIMNAWSGSVQKHINANAPLVAAWAAEVWPRAAEIIHHTTPKGTWSGAYVKRFKNMLKRAYLPYIINGRLTLSGGNWELSMAEGVINIAVFLDNPTLFKKGIALWNRRVPAYFYLKSDGNLPRKPPVAKSLSKKMKTKAQLINFWHTPGKWINGLSQETCRDMIHTNLGIAAAINAAETARLQGVNLYKKQKKRLVEAVELHAGFSKGGSVPVCGGKLTYAPVTSTYEMAFNHFAHRMHVKMPKTKSLLPKIRPTGTSWVLPFSAWESLTHAYTGGN